MHRSGTQSINRFLDFSGYKPIHNPSGRSNFDFQHLWCDRYKDLDYIFNTIVEHCSYRYNAVSDNPMAALYEQAYIRYPSSKFILSTRDVNDWIKSVRKHIGSRDLVPAEIIQYWKFTKNKPKKINDLSDMDMKNIYLKHIDDIKNFFQANNILSQLCTINLDANNLVNGKELSCFLKVPLRPLPNIDHKCRKQNITLVQPS